MATKRKTETLEDPELEAMRDKIRRLEATLQAKDKELQAKDKELQVLKNGGDQEKQASEVIDFLSVFMNNQGFKCIADRICHSWIVTPLSNVALCADFGKITLTMNGQCFNYKSFTCQSILIDLTLKEKKSYIQICSIKIGLILVR